MEKPKPKVHHLVNPLVPNEDVNQICYENILTFIFFKYFLRQINYMKFLANVTQTETHKWLICWRVFSVMDLVFY